MKIYTKQGDAGQTGLVGGQRVSKDDQRIEAYGTIDELSAAMGLVVALTSDASLAQMLRKIQCDLFVIGADLATPSSSNASAGEIVQSDVERLEKWIDDHDSRLPALRHFVLPGGSAVAAHLHWARVVCRRAERRAVSFAESSSVGSQLIPYLNRLSDLLFVLARWANASDGVEDIRWLGKSDASGKPDGS